MLCKTAILNRLKKAGYHTQDTHKVHTHINDELTIYHPHPPTDTKETGTTAIALIKFTAHEFGWRSAWYVSNYKKRTYTDPKAIPALLKFLNEHLAEINHINHHTTIQL